MGFTDFPEFPHTHFENDPSMHEFIGLYRELVDKYSGTYDMIRSLTQRVDKYEANINKWKSDLESIVIPNMVKNSVSQAMSKYEMEVKQIQSDIVELQKFDSRTELRLQQLAMEIDAGVKEAIMISDEHLLSEVAKINASLDTIRNSVTELDKKYTNVIDRLKAEMAVRDEAVLASSKRYTDSKVSEIFKLIHDLDLDHDEHSLKWLWDNGCNFGGYDAYQWYMDVEITAQMWHDLEWMDCVDWYVRGREVFRWFDRKHRIFSPWTGKLSYPEEIFTQLFAFLKVGGLTAGEYEDKKVSAERYEEMDIDAKTYDWLAKLLNWKGEDKEDV